MMVQTTSSPAFWIALAAEQRFNDLDYISASIWDERDWDPDLQLLMCTVIDLSRPIVGALFLDIGANMGFFTLLAAASGWTTIAVEALPANAQLLSHSLRFNGLSSRVTLHNRVVGEPGASAHLCVCRPPGNPSNGILVPLAAKRDHPFCRDAPEDCEAAARGATLDELVPEGVPVALMKLDVEGYELPALRGASRLLSRQRPCGVVAELNPLLMRRNGYTVEVRVCACLCSRRAWLGGWVRACVRVVRERKWGREEKSTWRGRLLPADAMIGPL